jgi:hypothetical protein
MCLSERVGVREREREKMDGYFYVASSHKISIAKNDTKTF